MNSPSSTRAASRAQAGPRGTPLRGAAAPLVAAALLLLAGVPAAADSWGHERGWSIGVEALADFIGAEDPGPGSGANAVFVEEGGGGILLHLGYAFTPRFAMRLGAAAARHGTTRAGVEVDHASLTVEAHCRFLHGEPLQPYVFGGLGGAALEFTSGSLDSKTSGGEAVLGVGLLYHITRHLALDLAARLDLINWNTVEVTAKLPSGGEIRLASPVDESGSAGKLVLGLVWQF